MIYTEIIHSHLYFISNAKLTKQNPHKVNGNDNNGDYIIRFLGKSSHFAEIELHLFNSTTKKRTTTQNVSLVQIYNIKSFNSLTTQHC